MTIIRFGQSPSRILVAAYHWYDTDERSFRNFLYWRPNRGDLFKEQLIDYAQSIDQLEMDPIEAALLNVLVIIATGKREGCALSLVDMYTPKEAAMKSNSQTLFR